jgi:hypothetical protein
VTVAYLWWGIHKVELQQVLDAQGLQQQDGIGEICPLDFRNIAREELIKICRLCEQAVAEPIESA